MKGKKKSEPVYVPAPWSRRGFAYLLDGYLGSAFSVIHHSRKLSHGKTACRQGIVVLPHDAKVAM